MVQTLRYGLCIVSALFVFIASVQQAVAAKQSAFFQLRLQKGAAFEDIFERTLYYSTPQRTSGYATVLITSAQPGRYTFILNWEYYGRAKKRGDPYTVEVDSSGEYLTQGSSRTLVTESSGAFFNPWLWGSPPATLVTGTSWTNRIPAAWEVGPAGTQTVRVLSIDRRNDRIVLQRIGSGIGAPLHEKLPTIDGVLPTWGRTTWKGITIVRQGLIESDELVVRHELIVPKSARHAAHSEAMIEQIELGQVPIDGTLP